MADPTDAPAFILGLPRSGTTVLSYALNTHPEILAPPEPWILLALESLGEVSPLNPANSPYLHQAVRDFTASCDLLRAKRAFALSLYRDHLRIGGKSIFVDKTPRYWLKLPAIHALFPDARYIWLRRNPFAVLASMKSTFKFDLVVQMVNGADHPHVFDLAFGSRALVEFAAKRPRHLLIVDYEKLVEDPIAQLQRIFAFLGVSPFTIDLRVNAAGSAFGTSQLGDKNILSTAAFETDRRDAWRSTLIREEMQILYDLLGSELIGQLGYADVTSGLGLDRGAGQPQVTAERIETVAAAFNARLRDIAKFTSPQESTPAVNLAVRIAHRYPHQVLEALGIVKPT